jgi:hypothetical protein
VVCQAELQVVDIEVETSQHNSDIRIESAAIGNVGEVFWLHLATKVRVCTAAVWDAFRCQLGLDARLSKYEDLVLGCLKFEDTSNVDGCAVGGTKDFFLSYTISSGGVMR